jgi:hypothetical protein
MILLTYLVSELHIDGFAAFLVILGLTNAIDVVRLLF